MLLNVWLQLIIFCLGLEKKNKKNILHFLLQSGYRRYHKFLSGLRNLARTAGEKIFGKSDFWRFQISREISLRLDSSVRVWHSENSFATYRGGFYRLWIYAKSKIFIKNQNYFLRRYLKTGDVKNDWNIKL